MIAKHFLISSYRVLTRQKLSLLLNVLGLAAGIATFLVLITMVRFENSFDNWLPNARNIHRLTATYTFPERAPEQHGLTSAVVLARLKTDFPQIEDGTRIVTRKQVVGAGTILSNENVAYADENLFSVLQLPFASGSGATALANPTRLVLTESMARKFFGRTDVVGETLSVLRNGERYAYEVGSVLLDLPENTHLDLGVIIPLSSDAQASIPGLDNWGAPTAFTYVVFRNASDAASVSQGMEGFVARHSGVSPFPKVDLALTPVRSLHFDDIDVRWSARPGVDQRLVWCLAAVGLLTLVIAILNYINLATARAGLRAREIALRKVVGATRGLILLQILSESLIVAFVAAALGLAMAALTLPAINAIGGTSLEFSLFGSDSVLGHALLLTIVVGLLCGAYPALLLSRFRPASVLASSRAPGGGKWASRVRNWLTGFQFVIAVSFMICTTIIGAQSYFLRHADRGFVREGLITVESLQAAEVADRQSSILNAFRTVPGVVGVTSSIREPGLPNEALKSVKRTGGGDPVTIGWDVVSSDYFDTYGARLLAGRDFSSRYRLDDVAGLNGDELAERGFNVILNERAVRVLGFSSAEAALAGSVQIDGAVAPVVGVVTDVHFGSPASPTAPVVYQLNSDRVRSGTAAVRYSGVSDSEMSSRLAATWAQIVPERPFEAQTAEFGLQEFYLPDEQRARLFALGALLSIGISCLGLYGLAAFNGERRTKEMGIRKALGASSRDVFRLLLVETLRPVVVANIIAWPLSFVVMDFWLSGFDQRVDLNPIYFLGATGLSFTVAIATVLVQAARLASSPPALALRHE